MKNDGPQHAQVSHSREGVGECCTYILERICREAFFLLVPSIILYFLVRECEMDASGDLESICTCNVRLSDVDIAPFSG